MYVCRWRKSEAFGSYFRLNVTLNSSLCKCGKNVGIFPVWHRFNISSTVFFLFFFLSCFKTTTKKAKKKENTFSWHSMKVVSSLNDEKCNKNKKNTKKKKKNCLPLHVPQVLASNSKTESPSNCISNLLISCTMYYKSHTCMEIGNTYH